MTLTSLLFAVLLAAQVQPMSDNDYFEWRQEQERLKAEVEQAKIRAESKPPDSLLITILVRYADGSPARGTVNCNGEWCKYGGDIEKRKEQRKHDSEPSLCARNLPFVTDSRGACGFNPPVNGFIDNEGEEQPMTCYATAGTRSGKLSFYPRTHQTYVITIPGIPPSVQK